MIFSSQNTIQAAMYYGQKGRGTSYDEGLGVCTDSNGNIFATGYFISGTIIFGSDTLTNSPPQGLSEIFIVKYDPNGNVLWAKSIPGFSSDWGFSVSADPSGNVFVTGSLVATRCILVLLS